MQFISIEISLSKGIAIQISLTKLIAIIIKFIWIDFELIPMIAVYINDMKNVLQSIKLNMQHNAAFTMPATLSKGVHNDSNKLLRIYLLDMAAWAPFESRLLTEVIKLIKYVFARRFFSTYIHARSRVQNSIPTTNAQLTILISN